MVLSLTYRDHDNDSHELSWLHPVLEMAKAMNAKIMEHDGDKGPIQDMILTSSQCVGLLRQNVHEMEQAMTDLAQGKPGATAGKILEKAANIANYAMFCAQLTGAMDQREKETV